MKRHLIGGIVSSIATALTGCVTTSDIAAVQDFEPERYMGTWYEIARLPAVTTATLQSGASSMIR